MQRDTKDHSVVLVATLKQGYATATGYVFREHSSPVHLKTVFEGSQLGEAVEAVKHWLSSACSDPWKVIFDNYDMSKLPGYCEPDTFDTRPLFPGINHWAVLVMTWSSRLQTGHPVAVEQSTNMHDIDIDIDIDIDTYHDQASHADPKH
ncbi:hypothetical protein NX059_012304 [Plenodomus lindquistii]|nr:hypothetical protein NX059_012304 [Plenodomus lindquistii]